jgi:hypothetical protein
MSCKSFPKQNFLPSLVPEPGIESNNHSSPLHSVRSINKFRRDTLGMSHQFRCWLDEMCLCCSQIRHSLCIISPLHRAAAGFYNAFNPGLSAPIVSVCYEQTSLNLWKSNLWWMQSFDVMIKYWKELLREKHGTFTFTYRS